MAAHEGRRNGWQEDQVLLHRLCQSAAGGAGASDVKVAVMDLTSEQISEEDYKDKERYKYLYARDHGNHAVGPSWVLQKKGRKPIETAIREIRRALRRLQAEEAGEAVDALTDKWDEWIGRLERWLQDKSWFQSKNKVSVLITIRWRDRMPGEIRAWAHRFVEIRLFGGRRARSEGKAGWCAGCGREGRVRPAIPFDFFTVEKSSFHPMGREAEAWRNAPICDECAKWLAVAQGYLEEHLRARIAGVPAFVLPDLTPGDQSDQDHPLVTHLFKWREQVEQAMKKKRALPEPRRGLLGALVEAREEAERMGGHPPFRSVSLVFHERRGNQFLFLYTTHAILPRSLIEVRDRLEALRRRLREDQVLGEIDNEFINELTDDLRFVGKAWAWPGAGEPPARGALQLTPMRLAEAVLTGGRELPEAFWRDADALLRATYRTAVRGKEDAGRAITERALRIWTVYAAIADPEGLRKKKGLRKEVRMTGQAETTDYGLPEGFWERFFEPMGALDTSVKRAAFLIGALFGQVEKKQRAERGWSAGTMPVVSLLRGLDVSYDEIQMRIFPELQLKLRQLELNNQAIQAIQEAAAGFAAQGKPLSDEEARFCFCLGWALHQKVVGDVRAELKKNQKTPAKESGEEDS